MLNKINIRPDIRKLIVYIFLVVTTLAVYWQVNHYDFIRSIDDDVYVIKNSHIQSGITLDSFYWAFSTTHAEFWHPLTWLSLMFDYQMYRLNAGGYHLTNVILHLLGSLLLFWLFNRMTGSVWRSAFVAGFFALHPLQVESVAWITHRKDVLSGFFWMLTLCFYVYYTEKPMIKRYLLVLGSFLCALMSKPMVVTLPIIMILLDYWPLRRFQSKKEKMIFWQLREKIPFFILSAIFSVITLYAQYKPFMKLIDVPLSSRIANAIVSFVAYLEKTFWPYDLTISYPFPAQIPVPQILLASLLIILVSVFIIVLVKRLPYLFVGWLWFVITILPVIGIIQKVILRAMAEHYMYLPSIGIAIMLAWGIPLLFPGENLRKKILFPAGLATLVLLAILTWKQCGYWKNDIVLYNHTIQTIKDEAYAHHIRGLTHGKLGQYQLAIEEFDKALLLKPYYIKAYYNRGLAYAKLGQHQRAIENFSQAIGMMPDYDKAYHERGNSYFALGQYQPAIKDYSEALRIKPDNEEARSSLTLTLKKEQ